MLNSHAEYLKCSKNKKKEKKIDILTKSKTSLLKRLLLRMNVYFSTVKSKES